MVSGSINTQTIAVVVRRRTDHPEYLPITAIADTSFKGQFFYSWVLGQIVARRAAERRGAE
jgi:hypothetical protein